MVFLCFLLAISLGVSHTLGAPIRRVATPEPDATTAWMTQCQKSGGGQYCVELSIDGLLALQANADPCNAQNVADRMVDLSKTLNNDVEMVRLAQIFVQQPHESSDRRSVLYCQTAPKNSELRGLYPCQYDSNNLRTFTNGAALGAAGTRPFGSTAFVNPSGSCPAHLTGPIPSGKLLVSITNDPGVNRLKSLSSFNSQSAGVSRKMEKYPTNNRFSSWFAPSRMTSNMINHNPYSSTRTASRYPWKFSLVQKRDLDRRGDDETEEHSEDAPPSPPLVDSSPPAPSSSAPAPPPSSGPTPSTSIPGPVPPGMYPGYMSYNPAFMGHPSYPGYPEVMNPEMNPYNSHGYNPTYYGNPTFGSNPALQGAIPPPVPPGMNPLSGTQNPGLTPPPIIGQQPPVPGPQPPIVPRPYPGMAMTPPGTVPGPKPATEQYPSTIHSNFHNLNPETNTEDLAMMGQPNPNMPSFVPGIMHQAQFPPPTDSSSILRVVTSALGTASNALSTAASSLSSVVYAVGNLTHHMLPSPNPAVNNPLSPSRTPVPNHQQCVAQYRSRRGDTCESLARQFNLQPNEVLAANNYLDCNNIWPWTPICIPPSQPPVQGQMQAPGIPQPGPPNSGLPYPQGAMTPGMVHPPIGQIPPVTGQPTPEMGMAGQVPPPPVAQLQPGMVPPGTIPPGAVPPPTWVPGQAPPPGEVPPPPAQAQQPPPQQGPPEPPTESPQPGAPEPDPNVQAEQQNQKNRHFGQFGEPSRKTTSVPSQYEAYYRSPYSYSTHPVYPGYRYASMGPSGYAKEMATPFESSSNVKHHAHPRSHEKHPMELHSKPVHKHKQKPADDDDDDW